MPLDIGDYLRDTGHLTVAEHGAYLLLIMHYWLNGGLPAEERMIARISRMPPDQWSESRDVIAALFRDGWRHKRIDEEMTKAEEIINKRRSAAQARHAASTPDANALHVESTSSDTRVPPKPTPEPREENNPPAHSEPGASAGGLFDRVWEAFPRNPTSPEAEARRRFARLKAKDQVLVFAAAERYAKWFAADCTRRKRTVDAGLAFVPHLSTWLETAGWRNAEALPLPDDPGEVIPMTRLDRLKDREIWMECERIRGKKAPTSDVSWAFPDELISQAKANIETSAA